MANKTRKPKVTPPTNETAQQNKLIALTLQSVQKDLEDGTATSQVKIHFLKLATEKERAERKKLELEAKLLEAKIKDLEQAAKIEEMYSEVIKALKSYTPPDYSYD